MAKKIVRLERDTIIEATFEMRFQSNNAALSDLLPGIIFAEFKGRFPRALRTAASNLPRQIQYADTDLKYSPRQGVANDQFQVLVGDFVLQVSNRRPYVGWAHFKPTVLDILGTLNNGQFIKEVERFSLKYSNVVEGGKQAQEQFPHIRFKAHLGEHDLTSMLTFVRTEIHTEGHINIVELAPTTKVRVGKDKELEGILVTVDTIHERPKEFWSNREQLLDRAHDMEKDIFFGILTKETIQSLGPIYE